MFRTSNCSSSGEVLYLQYFTMHRKSSLVADTVRMIIRIV